MQAVRALGPALRGAARRHRPDKVVRSISVRNEPRVARLPQLAPRRAFRAGVMQRDPAAGNTTLAFHSQAKEVDTTGSYAALLQTLLTINVNRKVRMGVENTAKLQAVLGEMCSDKGFLTVHVGGTNGKGSVVTKVAKGLQARGLRVGVFTSPHVSSFRERIRVNDELITQQEVETLLRPILAACEEHDIPATFFELTTLLALAHFNASNVDFAVFEVGLGGRLDSTNILQPCMSVLTSLSLEHTHLLGNTLEAIAKEKVGIVKQGVPLVLGPTMVRSDVLSVAERLECPVQTVTGNFDSFEAENQRIAETVLRALSSTPKVLEVLGSPLNEQEVAAGVQARPPCRFQQLTRSAPLADGSSEEVSVVLDVAHNPAALEHLFVMMEAHYPGHDIRVVLGLAREKPATGCLSHVGPRARHIHLVNADAPRAARVEDMMRDVRDAGLVWDTCELHVNHGGDVGDTVREALAHAAEANAAHSRAVSSGEPMDAAPRKEVVLICGSFFLMSEARAALGMQQPLDVLRRGESLNEASLTDATQLQDDDVRVGHVMPSGGMEDKMRKRQAEREAGPSSST